MSTPMPVDSGSGSCSEEMVVEPIVEQVDQAITIIDSVREFISNTAVTWNKNQCKRIADRYNAIGERLKRMGLDRNSDDIGGGDSNSGLIFHELVKILKKGRTLVQSYVPSTVITSTVVSRTDNREAFEEINEDLDTLEAKFGLQSLREEAELSPGMEKLNMKADAEKDKMAMTEIVSQLQTTGMNHDSEKLAQVLLDKTTGARRALPSYLAIDRKSDIVIEDQRIVRPYVRQSEQDQKDDVGWTTVRPGKWLGCDFAIKVFKCGADHGGADQWNRRQLSMEAGSLVELQHPHVVRLVGFGQDKEACVFVMELMDEDLRNFMKTKRTFSGRPFTQIEELDIINQIAKGMRFLHEKGYAHGDLKCSNILIKKYDDQYFEVKISDLRGSQKLKDWDSKAFEQANRTRRPRWTAPEAIDNYGGKQPSEELLMQSDIYSFGMTCYEIVTGKYPFDGIKEKNGPLLQCIQEGAAKWNKLPDALDEGLKFLIESCWDKNPSKRPKFEHICLLLNFITSKMPVDVKSMYYGVPVLLRQFKQKFFAAKQARTEVKLFQSTSEILTSPHVTIIPQDQLIRSVEPIGEGNSGSIFKATWLGCTFAVKILKDQTQSSITQELQQEVDSSITRELQQEVDFLIKVSRHPCIVQMVGLSVNSSGERAIVMEYMDVNLQELIEANRLKNRFVPFASKKKPFDSGKELLIITKIALGMVYLHSKGLVHRDLNPSNVLVRDYNDTIDVKIVDFGKSHLEDKSSNSSGGHRYFDGVGTGYYRAPEMLPVKTNAVNELPLILKKLPDEVDLNVLKASDVYSFGMVCYKILTGEDPCSDLGRTEYAKVRNGLWSPKWPVDLRPELKSLVERCWLLDPTKRPTFRDICEDLHDIFRNNLGVEPRTVC